MGPGAKSYGGTARAMDEKLLERLACPACRGGLLLLASALRCATCGRVYPVVEGIAVLVADAAGERG